MHLQVPDKWRDHLDDIINSPGITVALGSTDTGKSSFCTILANHAFAKGVSTAIVDGDVGQSEIGPPTTIGMGILNAPIESLNSIEPHSLYFVGSTSPVGHMLACATGVKLLVERACSLGRRLIIVDTTGLIRGAIGRRLKTYKIELLQARHIVALQRDAEAEHILQFFDSSQTCTVHRLEVSPYARQKSPILRMQRRATRFREYFQGSQVHELNLATVATSGTWLRTGKPLEPRYLKFASTCLGTEVLRGELVGKTVYFVTERDYNKRGVDQLQEEFGTNSVVVVPAPRYANLVVGLLDNHLDFVGLGITSDVDFRSGIIRVLTPLRTVMPIKAIRFGALKLRGDGTEIGRIRPGDV